MEIFNADQMERGVRGPTSNVRNGKVKPGLFLRPFGLKTHQTKNPGRAISASLSCLLLSPTSSASLTHPLDLKVLQANLPYVIHEQGSGEDSSLSPAGPILVSTTVTKVSMEHMEEWLPHLITGRHAALVSFLMLDSVTQDCTCVITKCNSQTFFFVVCVTSTTLPR